MNRSSTAVFPVLALACTALQACAAQTQTDPRGQPEWYTVPHAERHKPTHPPGVIGRTSNGTPLRLELVRADENAAPRPAILIVAGLHPQHTVGTAVATRIGSIVRDLYAEALERVDLYILADATPDRLGFVEASRPWRESSRLPGEIDADRDGRVNEDPPADLNGDGLITMMRIPHPSLSTGLTATHIADPNDPRLMRATDPAKGERAEFAVLIEGRDGDGDGAIAEDGPDGVDLNRNFPAHWPEFEDDAGIYPLSEPETLAIAELLDKHHNIIAVIVFGPQDTLVNTPPGGKRDHTGVVPHPGHILDEDRPMHLVISERYKEATGIARLTGTPEDHRGTLHNWAYAHFGVPAFSTPVWVRPDLVKKPVEDEGEAAPLVVLDAAPESEEGRWLAYSDQHRDGEGFVDWTPFEHPDLGQVEIGGFVPGFRLNPPAEEHERLAMEQSKFVADLAQLAPRLDFESFDCVALDDGLWRISARAVNSGRMPTRSGMGVVARRLPPTRFEIEQPIDRLISGERAQGIPSIPGLGGVLDAAWVVRGSAGDRVLIRLDSPECGVIERVVTLQ